MSSIDIVRLFPDIDGTFDTNDSFWALNRPWYGWDIVEEINAVVASFYANSAFIETAYLTAGLLIKSYKLNSALSSDETLDSALITKKGKFKGAFVSDKVN